LLAFQRSVALEVFAAQELGRLDVSFAAAGSVAGVAFVDRCQGFHAYAGSVSEPQGFGRLIGSDNKVKVSWLPNEGFLTSENFIVSSSPGVELGRWDKQNNNRAVKGYYV
jgi:hypothetical protein